MGIGMNVYTKLLIASAFVFVSGLAEAQNVHGVLRVVKGDVQVKSGKDGSTSKARLGSQVYPKDTIITGKDARAKIVMVDNNEINVSPESQIEIQNYEFDPNAGKKEVLLNVIYGKVRSKVEQKYDGKTSKFQIKTPSAVAGVRGTDFMTSFDRGSRSSQITTFHGKVEFGTPGPGGTIANPVMVSPGQMATSVGGAPPGAPTAVPKAQLAEMDKESKAETATGSGGGEDKRQPAGDEKKEKKEEAKKEEGAAKKDDGGAKKEDGAKKEETAAKKEDGGAKKEDTAAKKDDGAAKKDGGTPAKKEETAAKKDDSGAKKTDSGSSAKSGSGGSAGGSGASADSKSAGGSSTAGSGGASNDRAPASARPGPTAGGAAPAGGGCTMCETPAGGGAPLPPPGPVGGPALLPPVPTSPANNIYVPPPCDLCRGAIEGGPSKVLINVRTN